MLRLGFRHRPTVRFAFSPLWESVASSSFRDAATLADLLGEALVALFDQP